MTENQEMTVVAKLDGVSCISPAEGLRRRLGLFILVWMTCSPVLTTTCRAQCSFARSSSSVAVTYAFEPIVTDGKLIIHVRVKLQGGRKGTADLELPSDWAGEAHLESEVTNLKALSTDTVILDTARPNIKKLRFPPNQVAVVSYDLVKEWSGPFEYPKQFRPVLDPEFFEFNTQNALVHPKLGLTDVVSVHFDWTGLPPGWSLATSFGTEDRCQSFTGLWHKVNDALFAAGDFRLQRITVAGQLLVLAIRGQWPFTDDEALDRIQKIVAAERNFWHDNGFPYYLVTLKPFDAQNGSADGSAFTNAFWLYLLQNQDFSYDVQSLLAHESFHTWNPYKMGPIPEPEESIHWFTEGFTVYYSELLLVRAGLLSVPEYVDRLNGRIFDYASSPAKNLSNQEIVARYRTDNSANQLPYVRGAITALWLDAEIRKQSKHRFSLDTVMHRLVLDSSKDPGRLLTTQRVLRTAAKYLNGEAAQTLGRYVEKGETIPVPDFPLSSCVRITVDQTPEFDLGFDRKILLAKRQVSGLNPESEAFKAGLREGQQVLGMSIHWNDVSKPVRLRVRSGDGQQIIEYLPRGKTIPVSQYHLDEETWASTPEECAFARN